MVAILYEGKSDGNFFDDLIEAYGLPKEYIIHYNFEGKDNLFNLSHKYYDEIAEDIENGRVESLFIVTDADNPKDPNPYRGYGATKSKLEELIKNLDFAIPIDYYIFCDENKNGYLESFLLSVLDDEQKKCIEEFKECFKYDLTDKWIYNSFYKHNQYPFDFSHPNFTILKTKLTNLFEGIIQ